MTDLRIGIVGPGRIADRHLAPAIGRVAGATLWSVLSRDPERADAFATRHGAGSENGVYTDLTSMLGDSELDAVIVATPDRLHAAQTVAAAEAGKHVLVEKPMATSEADARRMTDACRAAGVRLGVAYHLRWHAGHRAMVRQLQAGEFGKIRHVRAQWTWRAPDATNWRASAAMGRWWGLAGVGTHCIDLVLWLLGNHGTVKRVESLVTRGLWKQPHDETAMVMLEWDSGATAEILTSVLFESKPRLEIFTERGRILCAGTLGPHGGGKIRTPAGAMEFNGRDPYVGEIADFVGAVREGREPEVSGEEGRLNVELLERADPGI